MLLLSSSAGAHTTRCESAIVGARTVALAAEMERSLGDSSACPTVETLVRNHGLDVHKVDDSFGACVRVDCIGDAVEVTRIEVSERRGFVLSRSRALSELCIALHFFTWLSPRGAYVPSRVERSARS